MPAAAPHAAVADAVRAALDGCLAAQRLVHELKGGTALPDQLHDELRALLLLGDPARVRAFCRELQKTVERSA